MGVIKLTTDEIRYISLFETITGAVVKDCEIKDDKIIFFVKEGHAGLAIGKNGSKIKLLEKMLGKQIIVYELSNDPVKFVTKMLRPARIAAVYVSRKSDGTKILNIVTRDKGIVKQKLKRIKEMLEKYFDIKEVVVV